MSHKFTDDSHGRGIFGPLCTCGEAWDNPCHRPWWRRIATAVKR